MLNRFYDIIKAFIKNDIELWGARVISWS